MQQAQQLGRYHLLDRIAFGGMAEIYRAKTADGTGRMHLMAVKRVLAHLVEDEEFIHMLIDEARLTALLKHPNIARIYEFCKTDTEYFISMEYVDGKDLRALLEKARQAQEFIPEEHLAYICMQVARGLHFAHHLTDRSGTPLNIVHRDVSPSNALISYAGEVKLCDFGIAKAAGARSQTKTGVIKGKVKYMSPEQAMGKKLDGRSDLFSLGTLLYEMVALAAPFHAQTEIELLFAVRDARKRPIRELRPNISQGLEIIIERAMAKQKERRFQDGEEFAESLRAFLLDSYPGYGPAQLSRYMLTMFAREREREQRALDDYVIMPGKMEAFGENLLADVMGPDAEYTQFTAAFGEKLSPAEVEASVPLPNPMQQMRVLSSVSMPELLDAEEIEPSGMDELDVPTFQRPRVSATELGLLEPGPVSSSPSASTMPRGAAPASAKTAPPAARGGMAAALPSGNETAILLRDTPGLPNLHSESTYIVGDDPGADGGDDGLHAQQTHILSRDQVEALIAKRLGKPMPAAPMTQPLAPPQISQSLYQPPAPRTSTPSQAMPQVPAAPVLPTSLADDSDLHAASTQILSFDSLPANIRDILQRRSGQPAAPAAPAPVVSPAAPPPSPAMNLQPLDSDVHELATAHLDWSPIDQLPRGELPAPPDPSLMQPTRPAAMARSATGAQAPISPTPPRSATGAQAPISPTPPRSATGAQAPIPMTAPRSATGVQTPISPHPARPATQAAQPALPAPRVPVTPEPITQPAASSSPPAVGAASQSAPPARTIAEPPTRRTAPPDDEPPTWTAAPPRVAAPVSPEPPVPPRRPTTPQVPVTPAPAAAPPRVATPLGSGLRGASPVLTPSLPEPRPSAPEPAPAAIAPAAVVMSQGDDHDDEWESLPHLDSTMMARGSELQIPSRPTAPVMPRAAAAARPVAPRARPATPIVEDYPTIPPSSLLSADDDEFEEDGPPTSEQKVEPITDASLAAPSAAQVADEPPTPPKSAAPSKAVLGSKPGLLGRAPGKPLPAAGTDEPVTLPKSTPPWSPTGASKGLARTAEKTPLRPAEKVAEKPADRGLAKAPEKLPEKAPEKLPERAPEKAPEKLADKAAEKPGERFDDLGFDAGSDFAEDTDKGGGPKGFGGAGAESVDPSPYLTGNSAPSGKRLDFLGKLGKPPGSSPRVPTSGGRPGAWDNLPRKK